MRRSFWLLGSFEVDDAILRADGNDEADEEVTSDAGQGVGG